ncbi:MAG: helix-turn-helix domain-containing protein [Cytophagaceae bacterium]|nr:helix-turn-helix domain-containing protein [Cytophagaceae bacterium]
MTTSVSAAYSTFVESIRILVREEMEEMLRQSEQQRPEHPTPHDRIGGVKLAVEVTGLAAQTVYNLVHRGELPSHKPMGKLVFSELELREWMLSNRRGTRPQRISDAHQHVQRPRRKKGGLR